MGQFDKRVSKATECLSTQMFKSKLKAGTRVSIHHDVYVLHGTVQLEKIQFQEKSRIVLHYLIHLSGNLTRKIFRNFQARICAKWKATLILDFSPLSISTCQTINLPFIQSRVWIFLLWAYQPVKQSIKSYSVTWLQRVTKLVYYKHVLQY